MFTWKMGNRNCEVQLNNKGGFISKWRDGFFTEKLDLL